MNKTNLSDSVSDDDSFVTGGSLGFSLLMAAAAVAVFSSSESLPRGNGCGGSNE
jgi:hypothetical protein